MCNWRWRAAPVEHDGGLPLSGQPVEEHRGVALHAQAGEAVGRDPLVVEELAPPARGLPPVARGLQAVPHIELLLELARLPALLVPLQVVDGSHPTIRYRIIPYQPYDTISTIRNHINHANHMIQPYHLEPERAQGPDPGPRAQALDPGPSPTS